MSSRQDAAYLLNVGLEQQLGPDRLAAAAHTVAQVGVTPGQLLWTRAEVGVWLDGSRTCQSILFSDARRGEMYLQQQRAVLQMSLAALQSVPVVIQDCKQSLQQTRDEQNKH